jgi:NDP-sugar pyrophosphorylase family protein
MSRLTNITAVVLAGGLGTRLRSVMRDRPKVLAEVNGRPFLSYLLDQLTDAGVQSIVLCTGYGAEAVACHFGPSYRCASLTYSRETSALGTGGALRLARTYLRSDPVLVLNGDSYCAADLPAFLERHRRTGAEASLLLAEVPDSSRFGRVEVDDDGTVRGFVEKAAGGGPGWINAGVYLLGQRFLQALPDMTPLSIERDVFSAWVGRGLAGYRSAGWFIDIGTPQSYAEAERLFAELVVRETQT